MGFFAGELEQILRAHLQHPGMTPWTVLMQMNVRARKRTSLQNAVENIDRVVLLPAALLERLREELEFTTEEWARLQSAIEADIFMRIVQFHSYDLDDAVNTANTVFANTLQERLATKGSNNISPELSETNGDPSNISHALAQRVLYRRAKPPQEEDHQKK